MYNIYKIINLDNGRVYIGMTEKEVKRRYGNHICALRMRRHRNLGLQRDWNQGHQFIVAKITWRKNKADAKALETELMNQYSGSYNIARKQIGDFAGNSGRKFSNMQRPYIYDEIIKMRDHGVNAIIDKFHISPVLVSLIWNGHRTAPAPQTSFQDVISCDKTMDYCHAPAASEVYEMYWKEAV